jgi:hypothetical protein
VLLVACSVFPEEAVLPDSSAGSAGIGNDGGVPSAEGGSGGEGAGAVPTGGTPMAGTSSGGADQGGAGATNGAAGNVSQGGGGQGGSGQGGSGQGGSGQGGSGQGGGVGGQAGMGGVGGGKCENPESYVVTATWDSWIGSAAPSANHGDESLLYVSGGSDERRALFSLTIPAALAGARLLRAEVVLSLESNADPSKLGRKLVLRRLQSRAVREDKVTWTHFAQGNNAWDTPGGDLDDVLAETAFPPSTTKGLLGFDVLAKLLAGTSASATTYDIAVLEAGTAPQAPAQLAFTSRQSNVPGSPAPELRLSYCPP